MIKRGCRIICRSVNNLGWFGAYWFCCILKGYDARMFVIIRASTFLASGNHKKIQLQVGIEAADIAARNGWLALWAFCGSRIL